MTVKTNQALLALSPKYKATVLLPLMLSPTSDVFCLSLRNLSDAVLRPAPHWGAPPNASPRCDEVSVATGVREGIGGAA